MVTRESVPCNHLTCATSFPVGLRLVLAVTWTLLAQVPSAAGHGRLMDPPARNSMWRLGFPNPVNYNDNELYCGGRVTQWARNKGRCGVCGDPHHAKREHEVGGKYANGIIARDYKQGDVIEVTVHITANHKGYFEFRICPVTDPKVEVTQACLDKHLLELANTGGHRFPLPEGKSNQFFNVSLRLPPEMTCKQCVIQWKYRTGNTWDKDERGKFCVGCGPQEEFYNCADVAIHPVDLDTDHWLHGDLKVKAKSRGHHKKAGILFTNDESDLKKAVSQQVTDYGKQKLNLVQKMKSNKYSVWAKSGNSGDDTGNQNDDPIPTSSTRFSYIKEMPGLLQPIIHPISMVARRTGLAGASRHAESPGVAYKWRAGNPHSPGFEKIRQRFGYGSMLDTVSEREKTRGQRKHKHGELRHGSIHNEPQTNAGSKQGVGPSSAQRHGAVKNEISNMVHSTDIQTSPVVTPGATSPPPHTGRLQERLQKLLQLRGLNSAQRDTFLRRWKLLRLRHIAALHAGQHNSKGGNRWYNNPYLRQMKQLRAGLSHMTPQSGSNRPPGLSHSPFSPPPHLKKTDQHQSRKRPVSSPRISPHPSHVNAKTKTKKSRRKLVRAKLPSWLVKALRLKYHKGDEEGDRETGSDKETGEDDEYTPGVSRHPMVVGRQTSADKQQSLVHDNGALWSDVQRVAKTDRDSHGHLVSTGQSRDIPSIRKEEETESLVRYIVSLLLHSKMDRQTDKHSVVDIHEAETNEENASENSDNDTSDDNSMKYSYWRGPPGSQLVDSLQRPALRLNSGGITGSPHTHSLTSHLPNLSQLTSHQQWPGKAAPPLPSSRAHAQPFNSLILGREVSHPPQSVDGELTNRLAGRSRNGVFHQKGAKRRSQYRDVYLSNQLQPKPATPTSWVHSQVPSVTEFAGDDHHMWTMRALKRQEHYRQQQESRRHRLTCESLVVVGEGMDKWCTDNCNANFCPSSMCVCMDHAPEPTLYTSGIDGSTSRGSHSWQQMSPESGDSRGESFHQPGYTSQLERQSHRRGDWADVTLSGYGWPDSATSSHKPGPRPALDPHTFTGRSGMMHFRDSPRHRSVSGEDDVNIRSSQAVQSNIFMNRRQGGDYYSRRHYNNQPQQHPPATIYNSGISKRNNNNNNNNAVFPHQSPPNLSWLTTTKGYHDNSVDSPSVHKQHPNSVMQNFPVHDNDNHVTKYNHVPRRKNKGVHSGDISSTSLDQNYLGQNPMYLHNVHAEPRDSQVTEPQRGLKCKAIGAYAGLRHFDEWCDTTCLSTMCPLLVCSCHS